MLDIESKCEKMILMQFIFEMTTAMIILCTCFCRVSCYTFVVVFQQLPAGHSMVGESQAFCSKVVLY